MLAQPALDGARRGNLGPRIHSLQFDSDTAGTPAGVLPAQLQSAFQRRRFSLLVWPAGVIAGLQSGGIVIGPSLQGSTCQPSNRAQGQVELMSDF